jgi:hypothetical protein
MGKPSSCAQGIDKRARIEEIHNSEILQIKREGELNDTEGFGGITLQGIVG